MLLGVDIGGSHAAAGLIDKENQILMVDSYRIMNLPHTLEKSVLLEKWLELIKAVAHGHKVEGLGVAMPGEFDYEKGIGLYDQNKFTQFYQFNLKDHLLGHLDCINNKSLRFVNDADAFALGEYWIGSLKNHQRALQITLGTGLGASFLINGIIAKEGEGIPKNGTLYDKLFRMEKIADEIFSTRGITNLFFQISGQRVSEVKLIAQMAKQGDARALKTFEVFGENLALFLKKYLEEFKAEALVLGGNISRAMPFFIPQFKTVIDNPLLKIKSTMLGDKAAIFGAVYSFTQ